MTWEIHFEVEGSDEGKTISLDDLNPVTFDLIANNESVGSNWWSVYTYPGESFERLYAVVCACADHAGVPHPERAQTMRDAETLVDMLKRAPNIEDQPMVDGFPPVPDETEVGSSSGSPGTTDGPQTSSEDNLSETS